MEQNLLYNWTYNEFKINLYCYKQAQINRRINNLMSRCNCATEEEYLKILKKDFKEREKFRDFLTINVTEFYRNPELFYELEKQLKIYIKENKRHLKIWSAGCSSGCEAYTLTIMLHEIDFKVNYSIIASDIDKGILDKGKLGIYTENEVKNIPKNIKNKYFIKKADKYYIYNYLKRRVLFKILDLINDDYEGNFDLIICRNVLIYFNLDTKKRILKKFSKSLMPGGLLFIGATESLYDYKSYGFSKVSTFIYKKL